MVIAAGSYPAGRWFESDRRYQKTRRNAILYIAFACLTRKSAPRPLGQAVKTPPFHGGNMGSIPVGVTKKKHIRNEYAFLFVIFTSRKPRSFTRPFTKSRLFYIFCLFLGAYMI